MGTGYQSVPESAHSPTSVNADWQSLAYTFFPTGFELAPCGVGYSLPFPPRQYLSEVIQGFVQVGMHARGGFIGDLNRVFQNALGNDVALWGGCRLSTDEDSEVWVTFLAELL